MGGRYCQTICVVVATPLARRTHIGGLSEKLVAAFFFFFFFFFQQTFSKNFAWLRRPSPVTENSRQLLRRSGPNQADKAVFGAASFAKTFEYDQSNANHSHAKMTGLTWALTA